MTSEPPITKPYIAPRITRNKIALDKYLAENKIVSQWPAIEQQLFTYILPANEIYIPKPQ